MHQLDNWALDGIYRGYKEGKSQRDIAKMVGCTLQTVNRNIQKIRQQEKIRTDSDKKGDKQVKISTVPAVPMLDIDLTNTPTPETVKTDILVVYRHSLYELNQRMRHMTDDQVYQLSMQLLNQLNNGNTEP